MCFIWMESILIPTMSTTGTWTNLLKTRDRPAYAPHEEICWFHIHLTILCATPEGILDQILLCLITGVLKRRSWTSQINIVRSSSWVCSCFRLVITGVNKVLQRWWFCNFPLSLWTVGFHVEDLRRECWTNQ
jgi:hypothetical protein